MFRRAPEQCDPVDLAAGWDLLAATLRAGLALPATLHAVAEELRGPPARLLRETARATALGADAATAWEPALAHPDTAELARAAKRTARSGGGLAEAAAGSAQRARAAAGEHAHTRVQRASVWVAAPLGLCFLPAFLCLGVLPVVVGMVAKLTATW
ncbi:type II secretion system F family protein [Allosaccharopolyspora coralli]|uniref:type II secretion system F family protein n=1 Tax=Allosaccharopolyspora coralli TaxID=2665642 RepID=UPI001E5380F3|nr:type II secretion system F family protein [Allosaccharopolyspora coralli]